MKKENKMKKIEVEKITLNFGAGKDQNHLKKGVKLLTEIAGIPPVETKTKKRIATWGLRPGLPVGAKITLRGENAYKLLKRLLHAKENTLRDKMFDKNGSVAFGIPEYIDIPDTKYDPDIGILGLEVCVTLKRPGFRVKAKKIRPASIGKTHKITKDEAINFMTKEYGVKMGEQV